MTKRRDAGSGSVYQRHDHPDCPPIDPQTGDRPEHRCRGRWAASVDLGWAAGKRQRKVVTGRRKGDVEKRLRDMKQAMAHGVLPDRLTVAEWLDYWVEHLLPHDENVKPTTAAGYRRYVRNYLIPYLGRLELQRLRVEHIEAMRDAMRARPDADGGPLSDTTIKQAHKILTASLDEAVARERVLRNVAKIARPPKAARNPHPKMDVEQVRSVLAAAADSRELARFTVALILGLRQGEALGLQWEDVERIPTDDVDQWVLHVRRSVARIGGKLTTIEPKTAASHRSYLLPQSVVVILAGWQAVAPDDPFIFPGVHGGPSDSRRDWQAWTDALERAGLPHFPLHSARGSAASALVNDGVADWLVSKMLGHASVDTTRRHYIDATLVSGRDALAGLSRLVLP